MKIDKDWKKNIELLGKDGFEKSEMIRLGFWKPDAKNFSLDEEEKKLFKLYELQAQKNEHLNELNKRLKDAEDLEKQIEKIREIRIKRSRASRAIRLEAKNREKKSRAEELKIIKNSKAVITATKILEGQPRLLCEASSYGVPSIFPNFGGVGEYFPKNYSFSFEQYNYEQLKEIIESLDDNKLVAEEGRKAYEHINSLITESDTINTFNNLIK